MATTSWTVLTAGATANQGLNPIPAGGAIGDVLTKTSLTDYVFDWAAPSGGGGGGAVDSVFGRTGAVVSTTNDYTFAQIGSKPTTLSGYGITDAASGVAGVATSAAILATARTINGTSFNGSANITITDGSALTSLNASNLSSGTVAPARLGTGSGGATKFLREDNTWQAIGGGGDALVANPLSQFAATTSAQLLGVITDETGTGALVFGTNPTLTGLTLAGAVTGAAQEVRDVVHRDTGYYRSAPTITGSAVTFDYTAGPFFSVALNSNCTVTLSNPPASGTVGVITVRFTADGTLRTITWPASVRWGTAGAPVMTSTNTKVDYVQLITVDGGTTWDGFLNGQNF